MIVGLKITQYKGLKKCELTDLKTINILIGRNNSGKSSVLEGLYLASAAFRYEDPLRSEFFENKLKYLMNRRCPRNLFWASGKEVLWYNYDESLEIGLTIVLSNGSEIDIKLYNWHEHPLITVEPELLKVITPGRDAFCLVCSSVFKVETGAASVTRIDRSKLTPLLDKITGGKGIELMELMSGVNFIDVPLLHHFGSIERALWSKLVLKRLDKLLVEVLKSGYDVDAEDLTYIPLRDIYQLVVKLPKTAVRVDDLGDGARYSLVLAMVASLMRNSILLIEEPESHQHPGGLAKTLEVLVELVKDNKLQVFISTHSMELVRLLQAISNEEGVDTAIFFLERKEDGTVDVRHISPQDLEDLVKIGLDPRFLDLI